MKIKRLTITRNYIRNDGSYDGAIEFTGQDGDITLKANDALCRQIMYLCADQLIEITAAASQLMRDEILTETKGEK